MLYNGVEVISDQGVTDEEIESILAEEIESWKAKGKQLGMVELKVEGEDLVVCAKEKSPIRRVRRITGYLSTIDQFNDAKRQEERSRIAHII